MTSKVCEGDSPEQNSSSDAWINALNDNAGWCFAFRECDFLDIHKMDILACKPRGQFDTNFALADPMSSSIPSSMINRFQLKR